jgi:hypothetical protein
MEEKLNIPDFDEQRNISVGDSPFSLAQLNEGLDKIKTNNPRYIIEATAKILHLKILKDKFGKPTNLNDFNYRNYFHIFSEDFYLTEESNYVELKKEQSVKDISDFIEAILERSELSSEYSIISLIYIKLFLLKTGFRLHNGNIRTLIFVSILLAQKIYGDNVVTNKYFVDEIYSFYSNAELNRLEIIFSLLINFQFFIKMNEYSKYCLLVEEHIFTINIYNRLGFFKEGNSVHDVTPFARKTAKSSTIVNNYRN